MIGAFSFLVFQSWRNRFLERIRRIRQPKYAVGAVVGALWIYLYFFRFLFGGLSRGGGGSLMTPENASTWQMVGALILFVILLLSWIIPHERAALIFSEAEIAFLFPAPIDRRTLIHFKLLRSQIRILVTTLIFTLLLRRGFTGSPAWIRALGWWIAFSTMSLHFLGASFVWTILLEHGISTWKRRVVILSLVAAAAISVVVWVVKTFPAPDPNSLAKFSDIQLYLNHALNSGPLPWLLYPFRLVVRPYFCQNAAGFARAVGPALLILVLHYFWVIRSNVAFEEASVDASRKFAERIANYRANRSRGGMVPRKKKRPPFKLAPTGPPAIGFLWKNLIAAGQTYTLRFWIFLAWMAIFFGFATHFNSHASSIGAFIALFSTIFLGMSFIMGPQLVRQDFRTDLPMADLLKTYPLEGWQVALGELLAPAAILTGVQWLLILVAAGFSASLHGQGFALHTRLAVALGLAILVAPLNLVSLIIPNAAVLLFPAWVQTGRNSPQGIEVTGQRVIFGIGQLLVLAASMLPAGLVSVLTYFLFSKFLVGPILAIPIAALPAALVLATEAFFGLHFLGRAFNRLDLSLESTS